jgi:hypothetical protein
MLSVVCTESRLAVPIPDPIPPLLTLTCHWARGKNLHVHCMCIVKTIYRNMCFVTLRDSSRVVSSLDITATLLRRTMWGGLRSAGA